jgi:hypothetical protein
MKFFTQVAAAALCLVGVVDPASSAISAEIEYVTPVAETPVEEVQATIKKMIKLIEEQKTLELLEKYTDVPAEKTKAVAAEIQQEKLDQLKMYLEKALKLEPKIQDDGKIFVFESDELPRPMKFGKVGERWIMKNK